MFRLVLIDLLHRNGVGFSFRLQMETLAACIVIAKVADTVVFIYVSFPPKTEVALVRHREAGCLVVCMAEALFTAEDCTIPIILRKKHPCVLSTTHITKCAGLSRTYKIVEPLHV